MTKLAIVIGFIAIFSAVILQTNADLKCYTCGPDVDGSNCYNAIFNATHEQTCKFGALTATKCLKATGTHKNGTNYMIRGCDFSSGCDTKEGSFDDFSNIECYNCDSDLCNSSEWNSANLITMCLTVFVAYLVKLK